MQYNKYELCHEIIKRAEKAEIESRDMLNNRNYSSLNRKRVKPNFVKEAFDEIMAEIKSEAN